MYGGIKVDVHYGAVYVQSQCMCPIHAIYISEGCVGQPAVIVSLIHDSRRGRFFLE